jgi:hypothetical protein
MYRTVLSCLAVDSKKDFCYPDLGRRKEVNYLAFRQFLCYSGRRNTCRLQANVEGELTAGKCGK